MKARRPNSALAAVPPRRMQIKRGEDSHFSPELKALLSSTGSEKPTPTPSQDLSAAPGVRFDVD